jgi:hypothetical protein
MGNKSLWFRSEIKLYLSSDGEADKEIVLHKNTYVLIDAYSEGTNIEYLPVKKAGVADSLVEYSFEKGATFWKIENINKKED